MNLRLIRIFKGTTAMFIRDNLEITYIYIND